MANVTWTRVFTAASYVLLFAIGVLLGTIGGFITPVRVFGGVEGLAVVIAVVGNLLVGLGAGLGLRSPAMAAAVGAGWVVAVGVLLTVARGGDVVFVSKLPADPGVVWTDNLYLIGGLVGAGAAIALTMFRLAPRGLPVRAGLVSTGETETRATPDG